MKLTAKEAKIRELVEELSTKLESSPTWYTEDVAETLEKAMDWAQQITVKELLMGFVQK